MTIHAVIMDLHHDEYGWRAKGCTVDRHTIRMPDDASDATIVRWIKAELGIRGWRSDSWSGFDFSWRSGSIGAYAEIDYRSID